MSHPNAFLAPLGRLELAKCIVDDGWPLRRAAERFQVSVPTAARWARRYRELGPQAHELGAKGMEDRSSRPASTPGRTPLRVERRITALRVNRRWGPARIAYLLGMHPSTVHKVLSRYRLARLSWLDRATGRVIRRYEHTSPGDLWHRASAHFQGYGVTVQRVLTDNGSCYRSRVFNEALGPGIKHKYTRPYRPQTNGKVERFNRTMTEEWAYARPYKSEIERAQAFLAWLHHYNHHRGVIHLGATFALPRTGVPWTPSAP